MKDKGDRIVAALTFAVACLILVAFAVPDWGGKRRISSSTWCINNLRQIDGATQTWVIEKQKDTNAVPAWNDILPYLKSPPKCPSGGTYTLGSVSRMPTCSIRKHQTEWSRILSGQSFLDTSR
jgi:hypothetical protein